jgi:hypothetical protein
MTIIDAIDSFGIVLLIALPFIIWGSIISWRDYKA